MDFNKTRKKRARQILPGSYGFKVWENMQSRIFFRRKRLIIVVVGFTLFLALFLYLFLKNIIHIDSAPTTNQVVALSEQEEISPGLPKRLKIPSINVDAEVKYVGLTPDGAMSTTKKPDDVAWLESGPRPGEKGSAVIAGHFGTWKNGDRSVFDNLHKLKSGDKLFVEDENGRIISFVVHKNKNYYPQADATDVFGSSDDKAHLNLVTCGGIWDLASKSYSNRLVVFADKE